MHHVSDLVETRQQIQSGILRLKWLAAAARFQLALRRHDFALKAGFNPGQPRVPAGSADGGQWTSDGQWAGEAEDTVGIAGDDDGAGNDFESDEFRRRNSVDLEEEEARGGHAIRGHVGQSDQELIDVLQRDWTRRVAGRLEITEYRPAQGSFTSVVAANDFVNQTLRENQEAIDLVASGQKSDAMLEKRFGYITGKEAYRRHADSAPYIRGTYGVRVLIRHDPRSERGFMVYTAFPINERADKK